MITTYDNKYFAVFLAGIIGIFGAVGFELAQPDTTNTPQAIVKLERVEIVGKRVEQHAIAKLPRVVIEGRRMALADDDQVAGGKNATVKAS